MPCVTFVPTSAPVRSERRVLGEWGWLVAIALGTTIVLVPFLWPGGPTTRWYGPLTDPVFDEGTVLYDSLRIAHGEVMYRDFFEFQGPIFYYLHAALFAITGPNVAAARFLQSLIVALGALFIARMVARLLGRTAGVGAALLHATLLVPFWPNSYPHWLALTLVLAALDRLTAEAPRPRDDWIAGALLGSSMLTIQSLGLPALVAAPGTLLLLALVCPAARDGLVRARRMVLGALLAFAPWVLYFAAQSALGAMLHAMFVWPFVQYQLGQEDLEGYASYIETFAHLQMDAPVPWNVLGVAAVALIAFLPVVAAFGSLLAAGKLFEAARAGKPRPASALIAGVSVAAVTPMLLGHGRNDITHLAFIGGFGLLGLAVACHSIGDCRPAWRRRAVVVFATLGILAALNYGQKTYALGFAARTKRTFSQAITERAPLASIITKHTSPEDLIVAAPAPGGWIYLLTGRRAALPYTFIPSLRSQRAYFSQEMWKEVADGIARRRPRVVWMLPHQWEWVIAHRPELDHAYIATIHPTLRFKIDERPQTAPTPATAPRGPPPRIDERREPGGRVDYRAR